MSSPTSTGNGLRRAVRWRADDGARRGGFSASVGRLRGLTARMRLDRRRDRREVRALRERALDRRDRRDVPIGSGHADAGEDAAANAVARPLEAGIVASLHGRGRHGQRLRLSCGLERRRAVMGWM